MTILSLSPTKCRLCADDPSRPVGDRYRPTASGCLARRQAGGSSMDDVVNRFARELADAIAAAVAENPEVEACRERARTAGYEMKVTLEAVVGFVTRGQDKEKGTEKSVTH